MVEEVKDGRGGRVIDVSGNGAIVERRDGSASPTGDGGIPRPVYERSGGLQVGCTYITEKAMRELIKVWRSR